MKQRHTILLQTNCWQKHTIYKHRFFKKHHDGISLIEILVSIVVLALGLLGLASLQANSTRFNHSAYLRSVAVSQINDIIDRMRANQNGVDNGDYNGLSGIPTLPTCTSCTPAQIAQRDLYEWNTVNANLLASGQGTIAVAGNHMNITVMWDNERSGVTGTACSGNNTVDLMCLIMGVQL